MDSDPSLDTKHMTVAAAEFTDASTTSVFHTICYVHDSLHLAP